ncbi:MAG: alpha/beta hydrolase [Candidatus Solibacter usitatus]|nr:alpha/beta hydrolase [Candidatus Solibacter usitatus]
MMEPVSHFFYSHRLKLQFWDWGMEGKPPLVLVHGGLDHARNWDWVARDLREHFHVYALDLRGHGNSAYAPGATYSVAEHVLDLSALLDVIKESPVYLVSHSLGGSIALSYAGIYPDRVKKVISIEGMGFPPNSKWHAPPVRRLREWIEKVRSTEQREPHSYPDLNSAVARMKEANPHLRDEWARHLTLHGTNWLSDGSLIWKFDNYARLFPPFGNSLEDFQEIIGNITCPVLLFWGMLSWAPDPEKDGRTATLKNYRMVRVPDAGHWVHHDQLEFFLKEAREFLLEGL